MRSRATIPTLHVKSSQLSCLLCALARQTFGLWHKIWAALMPLLNGTHNAFAIAPLLYCSRGSIAVIYWRALVCAFRSSAQFGHFERARSLACVLSAASERRRRHCARDLAPVTPPRRARGPPARSPEINRSLGFVGAAVVAFNEFSSFFRSFALLALSLARSLAEANLCALALVAATQFRQPAHFV